VKFYVYIADAKVDGLIAALAPEDRERLAHQLDLDPASLRADETPRGAPDELRFARATAVARQLEAEGRSGPLQSGTPYVAEQLTLHWGRLRHVRGPELLLHETETPVAFAHPGEDSELIMVGSASHLLAQPPKATVDHASAPPAVGRDWFVPASTLPDPDPIDRRCLEYVFDETLPPAPTDGPAGWPNEVRECEPWMDRLARVRRELRALPAQRLEIIAKRVSIYERGVWRPDAQTIERVAPIVLATPVLVAMMV